MAQNNFFDTAFGKTVIAGAGISGSAGALAAGAGALISGMKSHNYDGPDGTHDAPYNATAVQPQAVRGTASASLTPSSSPAPSPKPSAPSTTHQAGIHLPT